MEKITKKTITLFISSIFISNVFAIPFLESKSKVNWLNGNFDADISFNLEKSNLTIPSDKTSAASIMKIKTPALMKDPLLSLYIDSTDSLGDYVEEGKMTLEEISNIIQNGKRTPEYISMDCKTMNTKNSVNTKEISKKLIHQKYPYTPEMPIETVPTRSYSGIIIDARGKIPVFGEYINTQANPCFFPEIRDSQMNIIFEKNMVENEIAKQIGIVQYHFSDSLKDLKDRVGIDPLYIRAEKIYGRNRTDPVISREEALKIISNKQNLELLKKGKIVLLLDKDQLIYNIKTPLKDENYYAKLRNVKQWVFDKKIPDVSIKNGRTGIVFSVNLKFIPDSPLLLPEEENRIKKIAQILYETVRDDEFTVLVEGHTADLGKPIGQMNLSIERTKTVINALTNEGIPKNIFSYKGYGATKPVAPNDTEAGRAQNRRVDITARPKATYIQKN